MSQPRLHDGRLPRRPEQASFCRGREPAWTRSSRAGGELARRPCTATTSRRTWRCWRSRPRWGLPARAGSEPLRYEGLIDRYLPDQTLDGRTLRDRTRYAICAAGRLRGGLHPDLLHEAGGGEPRLWTCAVTAVVLSSRAAADRLGLSVAQIAPTIVAVLDQC